MPGKKRILITASINTSLLTELAAKGLEADVIPFIETSVIKTKKTQQQIEHVLNKHANVIFTSNNAVKAVVEKLQHHKPGWNIYCIGNTTKTLAEEHFGKDSIVATADDGTALANKIIAQHNQPADVYFFCGNKRRDELPKLLKQNNITVNEVEVYTTTILEHSVEVNYDAVLFFSPSAVQGFFANNSIEDKTVLFAIGNTTANEIKKFSENEIIVSDKPDKKALIEKAAQHFRIADSRLRGNDV